MTETAAAPAPEEPKKPQITREEAVAQIRAIQEKQFKTADYNERLFKARRGYRSANGKLLFVGPSVEPTHEELLAMVPLKRDSIRYKILASNKFGLFSVPKSRGRKHPHMNKRQQALKSESLRIFGQLFEEKTANIQAVCTRESIPYLGIPESAIPELGARAGKIAMKNVVAKRKLNTRRHRRQQEFSRAVNGGSLAGNFGERNYVNHGGQFGA